MDNKHKDPSSLVDGWLDKILEKHDITNEIGPDEQAVSSAGLMHPDDMELARIVQESIEENWGDDFGLNTETIPSDEADVQAHSPADSAPDAKETSTSDKAKGKKKKGEGLSGIPHILATAVWLVLILAIGLTFGRALWLCAADVLALEKTGMEITITIEEGEQIPSIAEKLQKVGMINYASLFEMFADLTGKGENIPSGTVTFRKDTIYDYNALINAMSYRGDALSTVEIMIPEGYNCAQIFELLQKHDVCKVKDLEKYAAEGELKEYWFLEGVDRGHRYCLEGFLFPDTYEFYTDDNPKDVLEKFLDNFDYRFTKRMKNKFTTLQQKLGYVRIDFRDLVTMASMVEKEKASDAEGYTIASVFYNRLKRPSQYPTLDSDATYKYATQYYHAGENLSTEALKKSPYNTNTQPGLPAGPIANPGLSSLDAALDPESTGYYFFIYDKKAGVHRFSKNLSEHNNWANKLGY